MLPSVDLIKSDKLSNLLLNSRDRITQYIKEHGHWGELESVICKIVTNKATNPIVIDAGSNLGGFALPVANHIQDLNGSIHCFEPPFSVGFPSEALPWFLCAFPDRK